jgi:hypothetical protein
MPAGHGSNLATATRTWLYASFLIVLSCRHDFDPSRNAAERGIAVFHASFNSGQFGNIYTEAAPQLRAAVEEHKFVETLAGWRQSLGKCVGVSLKRWEARAIPLGGTAIQITADSSFEHGRAGEEFEFIVDSKGAKLVSYTLNAVANGRPT